MYFFIQLRTKIFVFLLFESESPKDNLNRFYGGCGKTPKTQMLVFLLTLHKNVTH